MLRLTDVLLFICGIGCALLLPSAGLPDKCLQPYSAGNCSNHPSPVPQPQVRWHYNSTTNTCQIFVYTGCGGTANNFNSTDYCYHACNNSGVADNNTVHTYAAKSSATLEKDAIDSQPVVAGAAVNAIDAIGVTPPTVFGARTGRGPTTKAPELISGSAVQTAGPVPPARAPRSRRSHDDHSSELDSDEIHNLKSTVSKLHHVITKLEGSGSQSGRRKSEQKSRGLSAKRQAKKATKKQEKLEVIQDIVKKVIADQSYTFAPKDVTKDDLATLAEVSSVQGVDALKSHGKRLKPHSDKTVDEEEEEEEVEEKKKVHGKKEHHHKNRSNRRKAHQASHKMKKEEAESPEKRKEAEFEKMVSAELEDHEDDDIEVISEKIKRIISDPVYVFSCNNITAEDLNTLHEMTAQSQLGLMKLELKDELPQLTSVAKDAVSNDAVVKDAVLDAKVTTERQTDISGATTVAEEQQKTEELTAEISERPQQIADEKTN